MEKIPEKHVTLRDIAPPFTPEKKPFASTKGLPRLIVTAAGDGLTIGGSNFNSITDNILC